MVFELRREGVSIDLSNQESLKEETIILSCTLNTLGNYLPSLYDQNNIVENNND